MDGYRVAVVSYVDGLGLAAEEWAALVALLQGYIDWCALLHLMDDDPHRAGFGPPPGPPRLRLPIPLGSSCSGRPQTGPHGHPASHTTRRRRWSEVYRWESRPSATSPKMLRLAAAAGDDNPSGSRGHGASLSRHHRRPLLGGSHPRPCVGRPCLAALQEKIPRFLSNSLHILGVDDML